MTEGRFPKPLRLGRRSVGWRLADIDGWLAAPGLARSLDALVELPVAFDSADTALFCFGLRATLDLDDLQRLATGVTVVAPHRGPLAATGAASG